MHQTCESKLCALSGIGKDWKWRMDPSIQAMLSVDPISMYIEEARTVLKSLGATFVIFNTDVDATIQVCVLNSTHRLIKLVIN
jgi:hypothetical protein